MDFGLPAFMGERASKPDSRDHDSCWSAAATGDRSGGPDYFAALDAGLEGQLYPISTPVYG